MTIFDPRRPELDEWLASLDKRERCTMLHAIKIAFPLLAANLEWSERCNEACRALAKRERERAIMRAMEIAGSIREQLRGRAAA